MCSARSPVAKGLQRWLIASDLLTQAEAQALRDMSEEFADDVRALSTLVHALRGGFFRHLRPGGGRVADAQEHF